LAYQVAVRFAKPDERVNGGKLCPIAPAVEDFAFLFDHVVGLDACAVRPTRLLKCQAKTSARAILEEAADEMMFWPRLQRARQATRTPAKLENGVVRTRRFR